MTCPKEFPMSSDWDDDDEEEGKDQNKEDQKDSEKMIPQTSSRFFATATLTPQPPKSSIKQFSKRSSVTPEKGKHRHNTITILLWHENQDILEDND